jgi:hypothetical protein
MIAQAGPSWRRSGPLSTAGSGFKSLAAHPPVLTCLDCLCKINYWNLRRARVVRRFVALIAQQTAPGGDLT